jgi:hypothetical protein
MKRNGAGLVHARAMAWQSMSISASVFASGRSSFFIQKSTLFRTISANPLPLLGLLEPELAPSP